MSGPGHLWLAGGASVIGTAHERRGLPNQDAAYWSPASSPDERFVLAVADGHGGPAHPRSEHGARFALAALRELLEWFFDEPEQLERLPGDLVAVWRRHVLEHVSANHLDGPAARAPFKVYGTTLVAVAATPGLCLAAQIGDGDLMLGYSDGSIVRPFAADELAGEQTYSLGMDNAPDFVKYRLYDYNNEARWPDFALIATDGVSKSFVDDATFARVVAEYRDLVETRAALAATLAALPDWLREVSGSGSGDDVSLCIATRRHLDEQQTIAG